MRYERSGVTLRKMISGESSVKKQDGLKAGDGRRSWKFSVIQESIMKVKKSASLISAGRKRNAPIALNVRSAARAGAPCAGKALMGRIVRTWEHPSPTANMWNGKKRENQALEWKTCHGCEVLLGLRIVPFNMPLGFPKEQRYGFDRGDGA